jgi:hypothetical protein
MAMGFGCARVTVEEARASCGWENAAGDFAASSRVDCGVTGVGKPVPDRMDDGSCRSARVPAEGRADPLAMRTATPPPCSNDARRHQFDLDDRPMPIGLNSCARLQRLRDERKTNKKQKEDAHVSTN